MSDREKYVALVDRLCSILDFASGMPMRNFDQLWQAIDTALEPHKGVLPINGGKKAASSGYKRSNSLAELEQRLAEPEPAGMLASSEKPYYMIERNDRGRPEWLQHSDRQTPAWRVIAAAADHYATRESAAADAITFGLRMNLTLRATEHLDMKPADGEEKK